MKSHVRTIFALILALLTLASACGGEEKEQNEQPQTQGTSAGFTTYAVRSAGVSIAVPESWETATADEIFTDEAIDEIAGDRPEVAEVLHSLGQSNSLMKFFAFDRNASGNYATNASIVVEELPSGLTADRYFEASLTQLKRFVELEGLEQGRVQLHAGHPRTSRLDVSVRAFRR
jgi:hypothetical protein